MKEPRGPFAKRIRVCLSLVFEWQAQGTSDEGPQTMVAGDIPPAKMNKWWPDIWPRASAGLSERGVKVGLVSTGRTVLGQTSVKVIPQSSVSLGL